MPESLASVAPGPAESDDDAWRSLTAELVLNLLVASAGEMSEVSKSDCRCALQYGALFLLLLHPGTG